MSQEEKKESNKKHYPVLSSLGTKYILLFVSLIFSLSLFSHWDNIFLYRLLAKSLSLEFSQYKNGLKSKLSSTEWEVISRVSLCRDFYLRIYGSSIVAVEGTTRVVN